MHENPATGLVVADRLHVPALAEDVRVAFLHGMSAALWVSVVVSLVGAVTVWRRLPDGRDLADRTGVPTDTAADGPESGHAHNTLLPRSVG